ncbi:hypothetical protein JIN84_05190 [Luteolibacter yonseiensis]|uniref:AAA domain-containing protein n=1 Tax=Luteolibacter yonseiensis TaxID=1144680 RepID=A0A934QYF5_9BACT|nr:hypothetical protein [Luteolibacter yonseiensis]MBK1814998.1 hypothetical protein [Luteolibacter yonseiensis]
MTVAVPKVAHEQLLAGAETAARRLIRSWIEYGPKEINDFGWHAFPTAPLQDVAGGVRQAMLEEGVKDFPGLVVWFAEAPASTRDELIECSQAFGPMPSDCGPLLNRLAEYDKVKRQQLLVWKLNDAIAKGDDISPIAKELAEIGNEGATQKSNLRERAYALRFDPDKTPPPDEACMVIGDIPIAARGNITVLQGKSKVGKSALISAIMGAAQRGRYQAEGDTLCISWAGEDDGALVHLDTEQSQADWHALVCRSIHRSGLGQVSPRLVSLPLVMFRRTERLEILRQTLTYEDGRGGSDLVLLDGVADLCISPNDEGEALELVSRIHAMAQEFRCAIFCVLHENPTSDQGKTRGHLGSELNRKAFANLRIDKDAETSISTIYGSDMRKREIPKEQGFCFGWDDSIGMHKFQGRAAGVKAAQIEMKAVQKARAEWEPIFQKAEEIGTKSSCPGLTPDEAAIAERDISGTESLTKTATMKKRMQRAEAIGVLRNTGAGIWVLNPIGTIGT